MKSREIKHLIVDINLITPHPQNVRQGDIGAISESLKAHGQYRTIVVDDRTKHILAGNHTWKAAKALGWKQISISVIETESDEEALRILLADNRANDLAIYADDDLAKILKELAATETGLVGTLFDGDDLDDLLFKLEGSSGFVATGATLNDKKDIYENAEIRNLTLPYDREKIETVKQNLTDLMKKTGATSFSDVVWDLIKQAI